jgi:hypothetical protein
VSGIKAVKVRDLRWKEDSWIDDGRRISNVLMAAFFCGLKS